MTHERRGATDEPSKNGHLCYTDDIDRPLREAAQKKVPKYQNAYANDHNIAFMPAITSTTGRLDAEFLRLLFWHAHRVRAWQYSTCLRYALVIKIIRSRGLA